MSTPHPIGKDELIEALAAIEHQRWADWQAWVHEQLIPTLKSDPNFQIPKETIKRWHEQIITPYADLTEKEKQSDRDQVMRYLHLLDAYTIEAEKRAELRGRIEANKWWFNQAAHVAEVNRVKLDAKQVTLEAIQYAAKDNLKELEAQLQNLNTKEGKA